MSGFLILSVYILTMNAAFDITLYGDAFRSSEAMVLSSSSIFLNSFIMATSLLNVVSHSAVVLGALNDTYVISIIVGVGFDVMTRILQFVWWMHITWISWLHQFQPEREVQVNVGEKNDMLKFLSLVPNGKSDTRTYGWTILYMLVLGTMYTYHMIIHVRALRMNDSQERLVKVLNGASNNLRGIPGKGLFNDHFFAYTDLGGHLLPFGLSATLLYRQHALLASLQVLAIVVLFSYVTLSRIPLNGFIDDGNSSDYDKHKLMALIRMPSSVSKSIICGCEACQKRGIRQCKDCSFTLNCRDGVCQLWLCSFETLSTFLRSSRLRKRME